MDIRKRRLELGYETQTAFAKATGISLGSVNQVENHVVLIANMPDERKKVWAEALKLPIGELTKDDDKRRHERCVFPCKTYKVDKEDLERQLKERWGDKIGEVREEKINSLYCHEFIDYARKNRWYIEDNRMSAWGNIK